MNHRLEAHSEPLDSPMDTFDHNQELQLKSQAGSSSAGLLRTAQSQNMQQNQQSIYTPKLFSEMNAWNAETNLDDLANKSTDIYHQMENDEVANRALRIRTKVNHATRDYGQMVSWDQINKPKKKNQVVTSYQVDENYLYRFSRLRTEATALTIFSLIKSGLSSRGIKEFSRLLLWSRHAYNRSVFLYDKERAILVDNEIDFVKWLHAKDTALPELKIKSRDNLICYEPFYRSFCYRDVNSHLLDPRFFSEIILSNKLLFIF